MIEDSDWTVNTVSNCCFHSTRLSKILLSNEDVVYSSYEMIGYEKNLLNKLKTKEEPNFKFLDYVDDAQYLESTLAIRNGTTQKTSFLTETLCYFQFQE
jgi:hypothetical protein